MLQNGIKIFFFLFVFFIGQELLALSFRTTNPISWMHHLPTGDFPGWKGRFWFNYELGFTNIWNAPAKFKNEETEKIIEYEMDYEQLTQIFVLGFEVSSTFAIEFELPYQNRFGGTLDPLIDGFHQLIRTTRMLRDQYPENKKQMSIKVDGTELIDDSYKAGFSNYKVGFKYWPFQIKSRSQNQNPGGLSFGYQYKIPAIGNQTGLSSGTSDQSVLLYLSTPIGKKSSIGVTGAMTWLGANRLLKEFPRQDIVRMYELDADLYFSQRWSFIFNLRLESPFMDQKKMRYIHPSEETESIADEKVILYDRLGTAWNSFVRWRTTWVLGFQWGWSEKSLFRFLFLEDTGFGVVDSLGEPTHSTNSPDVGVLIQALFHF